MKTIMLAANEGERRWFYGGGTHLWKVTGEQSNGAISVFEDVMVRGKTTPLHCHPHHDELAYVIEGEILMHTPDGECRLGPGSTLFIPRGTVHAFLVVSDTARILALATPGTADQFFREASVPSDGAEGPVDFKRIGEVAAKTGCTEILGPPPFAL